jgi:hypothetical protein
VERESGPPRRDGEHALSPEMLAGLGTDARQVIAEVIMLHREFPAWAVWLPGQGRPWTAVRPASARAPSPDLPMVWVHGVTPADLADRMRAVDRQLADRER